MVKTLFTAGFATAIMSTLLYADYGTQALRGPLSPEPHFQTSQGREAHRFSKKKVNEYRLYDFYSRQAKYHLGSGSKIDGLLLPFPGLDGGRQGHWGITNEKSCYAYDRTENPEFRKITSRNDKQFVKSSSNSVLVFKDKGLEKVMLNCQLKPYSHPLGPTVDRYGMGMHDIGQKYLKMATNEWADLQEKAIEVKTKSYYLNQQRLIFRRELAGSEFLERSEVFFSGTTPVLSREFEFTTAAKNLTFLLALPEKSADFKAFKSKMESSPIAQKISYQAKVGTFTHQLVLSNESSSLTLKADQKTLQARVELKDVPAGTRFKVLTWLGGDQKTNTAFAELPKRSLQQYTKGGAKRFKKAIVLKGQINADPAATQTAYVIDDIPIPFANPYKTPMTLSGVAFAKDGSAYVTTMMGDLWRVSGLDETLNKVSWQRCASGLNLPMGICIVKDEIYVLCRDRIMKLKDLNKDYEIDAFETHHHLHQFYGLISQNLNSDAQGNLYFNNNNGIYKVSADGKQLNRIGHGARNSFGLGVRADGLSVTDSSEGNNNNGTCTIYESDHQENKNTVAKMKRIFYLPRGIDNSPGSRLFASDPRFGPLSKNIIGLSYGAGSYYMMIRDANEGHPQAAIMPLPGDLASGACRLTSNPADGQVYITGFDGWGDYAVQEGCFHRLRYTGKKALVPQKWQAHTNGLAITFNSPVDKESLNSTAFFVQQWNYRDSHHTYGSNEYSVKKPNEIGHDHLAVKSIKILEDQKTVFFEISGLEPAMCTQIYGEIKGLDASKVKLNLFATINKLRQDHPAGKSTGRTKDLALKVPTHANNGATYQKMLAFFDKKAGRDVVKRPVGQSVKYKAKDLNYAWINKHIIQKQCIMCHSKGTQHDFSTYEGLKAKIDLKRPKKSHIYGMVSSQSMPPYPMQTVAPEMQQALIEWIKRGAPEK